MIQDTKEIDDKTSIGTENGTSSSSSSSSKIQEMSIKSTSSLNERAKTIWDGRGKTKT